MKKQKNTCKTCKWLEDLPFTDIYICGNEKSSFDKLECDIENDTCEEWEGENERKT